MKISSIITLMKNYNNNKAIFDSNKIMQAKLKKKIHKISNSTYNI